MRQLHREWWLLVSLLVICLVASSWCATCPPSDTILPCRCSTTGEDYQIWCSYSNLPSVITAIKRLGMTLDSSVDEMIVEGNNLPSLPGRNFEGIQITRLMLRDNALERVTSNWLATLEPTLQELYLIEPKLRTLPPDTLESLRRLEAVTLQAGLMKRTPKFSRLPKLRYIQLQSPVLLELTPDNFEDLISLEQLHIMGSPLLNKLDAGLLRNLPKLSLITISNCSVSWLHPKTFINLQGVRELSLSWNRLSDAAIVGRACRDLQNLQVLRLENNFIDRLIEGSFVDMPSLRELYLSGNMISEIHGGAFRNTPSLKILDLNKNLLRRVNAAAFLYPSGSSLEELWLIDNQLYQVNELKALFNSLPRLRFIDMSKNQMEELPFDALRGHSTLERLHLNENRIKRLPKKAFTGMAALRELRLRNNSISEFPDGATWNLPSLKGLDLSQNKLRRLDARLMTYLPSLRRLDLSENFIDTVLPDTFIGNLELETINLSKNFVTSFHALTFSHLPKLYELDASWNRLREVILGLPRDLEYLRLGQNQIFTIPAPPSTLELPHLRLLDLSGNALQVIQQDTFRGTPRLQWLHINDNLLQTLENGSLDGLSRLELLNIRNNRLRDLGNEYLKGLKGLKEINLQGNYLSTINSGMLSYSPKLETIRLGSNKISQIQPGAFSNARELQELNLTHNLLERLPDDLQGLKMLRFLDVSHNKIRTVQPFLFESLPSLTELRLGNNRLFNLPSNSFSDLQKLEFLDLDNNELESIGGKAIKSLPSLIALQLAGNRLTTIGSETFIDLPELQSVDLHTNHLQEVSSDAFINVPHLALLNLSHNLLLDIDKAGVKEIRSLEVLDLSDNKVTLIEPRSFLGMDWLVELKMDNNIICHIHGSPFNELPRLRVLSLRHNRMTTVTETAFQQLRNNIAIFDIDGNPLSCSCRMLWLQAWLQDTAAPGPHCRDGTLFRDARLSRNDCAHSRIVEPVVPGCEEQSVRGPVVEALQINTANLTGNQQYQSLLQSPQQHQSLHQFPHHQNQLQQLNQNHHGSLQSTHLQSGHKGADQEPEYVYDEYVEYEEMNATDTPPTLVPVDVTAGDMRGSPHLITGDTPTLYASQAPPKLNLTNPGLGYNDIKKPLPNAGVQGGTKTPNGGYSGLTFFGIPLPSLSLGNIWKGRSTEASPYNRGRVQPVNPLGRSKADSFFVTPLPEEPSTTSTERPTTTAPTPSAFIPPTSILETGFMPMIPKSESPPKSMSPFEEEEVSYKAPLDDAPSSALPVEHRVIEETSHKNQWYPPKQPHVTMGKIEPVSIDKKEPELIKEDLNYQIESSATGNDFTDISQEDPPRLSIRSGYDTDPLGPTAFERTTDAYNFNSVAKATIQPLDSSSDSPVSNMFVKDGSNNWYYQNYNSSNVKPFVENAFVGNGMGITVQPLIFLVTGFSGFFIFI